MELNHHQKKYIKRHIKETSIPAIATHLNVSEDSLVDYLKKRWGQVKLSQFLKKQKSESHQKAKQPIKNYKTDLKYWFLKNWLYLLILTIIVIVVYANSFDNAFVSDDIAEIRENPNLGNFSSIFSHPFGFIRPLLYWAVFQLGGANPILFRLINITFHIGTVTLIYILVSFIYSRKIALFTSGLFAVHPVLIEAISWISGGNYTQYSFFFLLSFLFYILSKSIKKFFILSLFFFIVTLESHNVMPTSLILIFPLFELSFGDFKRNWKKSIPYIILGFIWILFNLFQLPERTTTLQTTHYQDRGVDNPLILIPIAITSYLQLIFFPKDLTLYHSELAFSGIEFIIRVIIFFGFILSIAFSFRKNKSIFFWLSFFLISLLPTLTPFRLNWIVAERYVYLGTLGIIIAFVLILDKLSKLILLKKLYWPILIFLIITLATRTIIRNIDWHSEDNLWIATGKTSPSSPNTHNNLGDVYGRWGDKQKALQEFQTAIVLKPNYADAYHNLANTYLELNDTDKAIENYTNAIKFNPNLWQSYQNIAAIYFNQKRYDLAIENIQKAISINPKNINLKVNLGIIYLALNEKEKAKEIFSQVLTIDPQNQIARQGLVETNK